MHIVRSSESAGAVPSAAIRTAVESVSEMKLRGWVKRLSVPRNFYTEREANREVAAWLAGRFKEQGYAAQSHGAFANVITLPKTPSSRMILVGAHYDSVPGTPGADDNASAVAAMLGCAEVISTFAPGAPVCFVGFNCEENDLAGSADFVRSYLKESRSQVAHAHILEMVGFASNARGSQKVPTDLPIRIPDTGNFLGLLANRISSGELDFVLSRARAYLPEFEVIGLKVALGMEKLFPVLARSDHVPFWTAGIPAVMWTDTSEFRNPNYHRSTDTPNTLDYSFLRRVTQLLIASVLEQSRSLR